MTELLAGLNAGLSLWQPEEPPGGDFERIMPDRGASFSTRER